MWFTKKKGSCSHQSLSGLILARSDVVAKFASSQGYTHKHVQKLIHFKSFFFTTLLSLANGGFIKIVPNCNQYCLTNKLLWSNYATTHLPGSLIRISVTVQFFFLSNHLLFVLLP